jgi:hypothetical protein
MTRSTGGRPWRAVNLRRGRRRRRLFDRLEQGQQPRGRSFDVENLAPSGGAPDQSEITRRQPPALGQELDQGGIRLAGLGRCREPHGEMGLAPGVELDPLHRAAGGARRHLDREAHAIGLAAHPA